MDRQCECVGVPLLDERCTRPAELICPSCETLLCVSCLDSCHDCEEPHEHVVDETHEALVPA